MATTGSTQTTTTTTTTQPTTGGMASTATDRPISTTTPTPDVRRENYYGGTGSPSGPERGTAYERRTEPLAYDRMAQPMGTSAYGSKSMSSTAYGESVAYERVMVEEPTRHESVGRGVTETFKHPIQAFKGEPRARSPTEMRRREMLVERRVPMERREPMEERIRKPRGAYEIRQERSRLAYPPERREVVYVTEPEREPVLLEEEAPTVYVEHRERGAVIQERIHPREREEIQPIIHREREKTEVVQLSKPIVERDLRPVQVEEKTLPAETRPTIVQGETEEFTRNYRERAERYKSSVEVAPVERELIERPAIVKEHITKKVIEEIQPVIYRDITEPHIIKEVKPIYEKVVEGPILLEARELPLEERASTGRYMSHEYRYPREEIRVSPRYAREEYREPVRYIEPRREYVREGEYYRREPEMYRRTPEYYRTREPEYRSDYARESEYYRREPEYRSERYVSEEHKHRHKHKEHKGKREAVEPIQYEYREYPEGSAERGAEIRG